MSTKYRFSALLPLLLIGLAGCTNEDGASVGAGGVVQPPANGGLPGGGRVFLIEPGETATADMVDAMVQMLPNDVLRFDCGFFDLHRGLQLSFTEAVTIEGCGRDETVLSFRNSPQIEGLLAANVRGLTVRDLTILDSDGNGIELRSVDHATLQRVRTMWSPNGGKYSPDPITAEDVPEALHVPCTNPPLTPEEGPNAEDYVSSERAGRYGIYPVSSRNVLIDEVESIGASDAGIYVGQTTNTIIRNSRAAYNVFGFEIENVLDGEYANNLAECNTGGFLIYDLENLRQYGSRTRMHHNIARKNNLYNFTEGGFVANVPPGCGLITLGYDRIDIYENEFRDNNTAGIAHASYALFPEGDRPGDRRIDFYTEGVRIWDNVFVNNGNKLPAPTANDIRNENTAKALPALVGSKNQAACARPENQAECAKFQGNTYRGAHIVWDGLMDDLDADCPYPKDKHGSPVAADAQGKPMHTNADPNPACHYNAYKFRKDQAGQPTPERIKPEWWSSCIGANNFSDDSIRFANFHGTEGVNAVINQDPEAIANGEAERFPSDFDMTPHDCEGQYGKNLLQLPPVTIPAFVPTGEFGDPVDPVRVAELCGSSVLDVEVNFRAAPVNCPDLSDYNLFFDPQDPRSAPNSNGTPFVLNSKLFSDYAVKYRVLFLPRGSQGTFRETGNLQPNNETFNFPVGTILAKTFAFRDETAGTETPVETRLLIKRRSSTGLVRWDGLAYVWETQDGKRVAKLAMSGATAAVSWDLTDADSGARHQGSTQAYSIPHAGQCFSCHSNEDAESGSAPIGLKARFLNRPYSPESSFPTAQGQHDVLGKNQLAYWCANGRLAGCPSDLGVVDGIATKVSRIPKFNVPGDAGFPAGTDEDIEARAKAWLEVNCQHCHNVRGFASNTGFYLDYFAEVGLSYGICKRPTAAGAEGTGGRPVDIHPGRSANSILEYRISPAADTPSARMPPLARSVVDVEGHALVKQWIDSVVVVDEDRYANSANCPN